MRTEITLDVDLVRRVLERSPPPNGREGYDHGDQADRVAIRHALLLADVEVARKNLIAFYREYDHLAPDSEATCELCGRSD